MYVKSLRNNFWEGLPNFVRPFPLVVEAVLGSIDGKVYLIEKLNKCRRMLGGAHFGTEEEQGRNSGGNFISTAVDGIGKTAIVYRTNLSFARAEKYIDMLLKGGLISALSGSKVKYQTTDKGLNFLKLCKNLKEVADLSIS